MSKKIYRFLILTVLVFSMFLVSSCNKVNKENFNKIKNCMTLEEVKEILGEPSDKRSNLHNDEYYWFSDARTIYEAIDKANEGKYCDYIIVVFSVEMTNNKQIVLNKKIGNTKEIKEE